MPSAKDAASVRQVILGGLVFGVAMGLFLGLQTGSLYYGFHGGFFCAVAFGFAIKRFLKVSMASPRLALDAVAAGFSADETVVHHGPANHFKGIEAVGGKLFLTNQRLVFRSHRFNVQAHEESYPLDEIVSTEPARTLGIVPNGLLLQMRDGRRERFVVGGRSEWVSLLRRAR
ncbi:MAG: hypothetical protein ACXWG6_15860 [Usitatibacter sp.]